MKPIEAAKQPLPDIIGPGLRVLFIGYNPSLRSAELGHHYAGRSNGFWEVLFRAGLTPVKLSFREDGRLLEFGLGSTNIVDRPTTAAAELTRAEYRAGAVRLRAKLAEFCPAAACYVGKGVYLSFTGRPKAAWGLQPDQAVSGISDFVAPSTSGLNRMRLEEQVGIYRELQNLFII